MPRLRISPPVLVAAAILVASAVNPRWLGGPGAGSLTDLSLAFHFAGYAVLAAAAVGRLGGDRRGLLAAVGLATAYGAGMELLHLGLAYRTASVVDLAANAAGAAAGATARVAWRRVSRFDLDDDDA